MSSTKPKIELTIEEITENLLLLAANVEHQRMLYKSKPVTALDKEVRDTLGYLRGTLFCANRKWNEIKDKL